MNFYEDVTQLIGQTPLLRLGRLAPDRQIFAKCEFLNPVSLKDRPVLQIVEDAEAEGRLKHGDTLIEATSGNTGMAVAFIAALKGYRAILVMSEIQSRERRQVLKAFGAELILTPASEGTAGARRKLKELLKENPDFFYVGQHVNPSNPKAHQLTTGPELWQDTGGKIDFLVAGLGTGGTLCGAGRYLKKMKGTVQLVAIEPKESPTISQGIFRPHRMMGTAPGFVPETLDRDLIDEFILVSEHDAFEMCRQIALQEGILVGISSGAAAYAALQVARRPENHDKIIVCVFADTGQRYLSVDGLYEPLARSSNSVIR
jgi:cysteine synthase A